MINKETIWITGASSGIGEELACQLAAAGNRVLVTARNKTELDVLSSAHESIEAYPGDVTDIDGLMEISGQIAAKHVSIDRIIINAGVCEYFDIETPDWQMTRRVMDVNFFGAINTVAAALPLLRKSTNKKPHIIVIASQASIVPFPRSEAYGASKAALKYFFESLRSDLSSQNIAVTIVQPGFVKTPLTDRNDFPMPFMLSVEESAQRIIHNMEKYPLLYRFPRRLAWLLSLMSSFPRVWLYIATHKLSRNV